MKKKPGLLFGQIRYVFDFNMIGLPQESILTTNISQGAVFSCILRYGAGSNWPLVHTVWRVILAGIILYGFMRNSLVFLFAELNIAFYCVHSVTPMRRSSFSA